MSDEHLKNLEALAHAIPLVKRKDLGEVFNSLATNLGLTPREVQHLTWPAPSWPSRGEASLSNDDVFRYLVDFAHGDRPDHRDYIATFEEVRKLLKYTRDSCKVAFGTNRGKIDRTQRPTKLGPCIITRLPTKIDPADYPRARRLSDRELELFPPAKVVGGKVMRYTGNRY